LDQSDVVAKGLVDLSLANPRLAPPLRLLLAQPIPRQVKGVVFMVPATPQGKVLFNLVRHVLELRELATAATMTIDLQRLQLLSQLIAVERLPSRPLVTPSRSRDGRRTHDSSSVTEWRCCSFRRSWRGCLSRRIDRMVALPPPRSATASLASIMW
jgi:hypothetical protein